MKYIHLKAWFVKPIQRFCRGHLRYMLLKKNLAPVNNSSSEKTQYGLDYLYPEKKERIEKLLNNHPAYRLNKKLGYKTLDDTNIVTPVYVCKKNELDHYYGGIMNKEEIDEYGLPENVIDQDTPAVFLGYLRPCWGHWITNTISRLWFLFSEAYSTMDKKTPLVFVSHCGNIVDFPKPLKDLITLMRIDTSSITIVQSPKRYKSIILPDESFVEGEYYSDEYKNMIDRIVWNPTLDKLNVDKVYFSRKFAGKGRDFGEISIERMFRANGYKVFYPEYMSVHEQLSILSSCNVFATTEGSTSHNALFMRDGAKLVVLSKFRGLNYHQFVINDLKKLDVTMIDSHLTLFDSEYDGHTMWGPFYLLVNRNVCGFLGVSEHYDSFSVNGFKKYAENALMCKNGLDKDGFYQQMYVDEYSNFKKNRIVRLLYALLLKMGVVIKDSSK